LKNYFDKQVPHAKFQTDENVAQFLSRINDYKLTKVEKLMLVNSRPTNLAALHVLIEEHEDRFSMDEMETIILHVRECFPLPHQR
jgi:RNA polymerase Rpb4